jgi:hypothetical protein
MSDVTRLLVVAIVSWGNGNWIGNNFNYRIDTADALGFIDTVLASIAL